MLALRCTGYAVEAEAHRTLAAYRHSGEWFRCPTDMAVAAIAAAAYRLGEPIASGDPRLADVIVPAEADALWLRAAAGAAMGVIIAFLIFVLT
jgi:hypothetical protein